MGIRKILSLHLFFLNIPTYLLHSEWKSSQSKSLLDLSMQFFSFIFSWVWNRLLHMLMKHTLKKLHIMCSVECLWEMFRPCYCFTNLHFVGKRSCKLCRKHVYFFISVCKSILGFPGNYYLLKCSSLSVDDTGDVYSVVKFHWQEKPSKWMFDQNSKGKAVKAIKVDVWSE